MSFIEILKGHEGLSKRVKISEQKLEEVKEEFAKNSSLFKEQPISAFCVGSLARKDIGSVSDLDLFITCKGKKKKIRNLDRIEMLASIIKVNRDLKFDDFSNDGEFLEFHSEKDMLKALGAPRDDAENQFTPRMLLLLESHPILNEDQFDKFLNSVLDHYFRDSRGRKSFKPLFLLNDMLRWWRTVCLNYELVRDEDGKPWRKKNINLKFSRMLTVFGSVLPIITEPMKSKDDIKKLTSYTPLERFAIGLDNLGDESLKPGYLNFLDNYEQFLSWKEELGNSTDDKVSDKVGRESREIAEEFSSFIYKALSHDKIDPTLKKYLML